MDVARMPVQWLAEVAYKNLREPRTTYWSLLEPELSEYSPEVLTMAQMMPRYVSEAFRRDSEI
jgi:hypothetical protein